MYSALAGSGSAFSDCTKTPGEMGYTATSAAGDKRPGKLSCFQDNPNSTADFIWVDGELRIVGNSRDATMSFASIRKWWDGAGPSKR